MRWLCTPQLNVLGRQVLNSARECEDQRLGNSVGVLKTSGRYEFQPKKSMNSGVGQRGNFRDLVKAVMPQKINEPGGVSQVTLSRNGLLPVWFITRGLRFLLGAYWQSKKGKRTLRKGASESWDCKC